MSKTEIESLEAVVQRLRRAFDLVDGFAFYLVGCASPDRTQSVVAQTEQNSSWQHARLAPHSWPGQLDLEGRRAVLHRLYAPADREREVVLWLDATEGDEADWRELFRRMNEQRNSIAKALGAPLVLVARPSLARAFAVDAPDFWSIRTFSTALDDG